jgi:hypothetical protein
VSRPDFTGRMGDREVREEENAFFVLEDQNKKCVLEGRERL